MNPHIQNYPRRRRRRIHHSSYNEARHQCPKCGRAYNHRSNMLRHYKNECGVPPRFQCPYCNNNFSQRTSTWSHIRKIHPNHGFYYDPLHELKTTVIADRNMRIFYCPNCSKSYKWKKSLMVHLRYQCRQLPRFECPYCGVRNYQKVHILRHLQTHHPGLSEICRDIEKNSIHHFSL
ncbi:zinc finger protein 768-like [Chelonus insularis]|uniref:zinc finger protein 768-like n=1 Tax=Chelonus insularis TaxID=460826 RepID=UPI0015896AD7|nr:zinc finger protein 768-like [Chelonus insularis]